VRYAVSIALYALFVYLAERQNESYIEPLAVTFLFAIAYYYISLILFQYSDVRKKRGEKYLPEFTIFLLSSYVYASRLHIDGLTSVTLGVMTINVLFSAYFLSDIAADCRSIPNIRKFYVGAFGQFPIETEEALNRVKPLLWFFVAVPFISLAIRP
jgi:hypothetical protein